MKNKTDTSTHRIGRNAFATTHWSTVVAAGGSDTVAAAQALEILCRRYWYPLYAFIRRRGHPSHEAEDLTQNFFAHVLDAGVFKKADRAKGRFRSFLLAALSNFLTNEHDKHLTVKRGGKAQVISLDEAQAEAWYREEPEDARSPEKLFDRRWAMILMTDALAQLKAEYAAEKKAALFATLEPGLTGEADEGWLAKAAAKLGMKPGAVRVAMHRLRRRYGELLRQAIANTVACRDDVEVEIRELFSAISQKD